MDNVANSPEIPCCSLMQLRQDIVSLPSIPVDTVDHDNVNEIQVAKAISLLMKYEPFPRAMWIFLARCVADATI
jgi:hypothetical protein